VLRPLPHPLSRRTLVLSSSAVLGALSLGVLSACGDQDSGPEAIEIQPSAPEQPDENLLDELSLIGAYLGAIEAFPELRGTLTSIADQHSAHARELGATSEQIASVVPIAPAAARIKPVLAELIARERSAGALRAQAAQSSQESQQVRTLTFIAASESSHIPELRDVRANL
jgi:hypothetical protein